MNKEEFYKLSLKKKKRFIKNNLDLFENEEYLNNKKFKFLPVSLAKQSKNYKKYFNYNNEAKAALIKNNNITLLDKINLLNSEDYGVASRALKEFFNNTKFSQEFIEDFCIKNPSKTTFYYLVYYPDLSDNFFEKLNEACLKQKPGFGIEYDFKHEMVKFLHCFSKETIYKIFVTFPDIINLFVSRYDFRFKNKININYIYDNVDKFYYVHNKLNLSKYDNFYILLKKIEWSIFL